MQRTISRNPPGGGGAAAPVSPLLSTGSAVPHEDPMRQLERQEQKTQAWKEKAHRLGDIVMRQEAATKELQRQLASLQEAQAAALAAATAEDGAGGSGASLPSAELSPQDLGAMRQQLVLAQARLAAQAEELEGVRADYELRKGLLKDAAGAARREVLALQEANAELQAVADRLQQQNEALAMQLRTAGAGSRPGSAGEGSLGAGPTGLGSAGPSPAKRHMDSAMLAAMLRKQDGELSLLREDSASQQEELLRTLGLLQAAHKREEDLRRQATSLEAELGITRDELAQKDAHLELLRDKLDEGEELLRHLHTQLAAAEQQAAAAMAAAVATAEASSGDPTAEHAAQLHADIAALRQHCKQAADEVEAVKQELAVTQLERAGAAAEAAHLRQQLQQRDAEVAQLRMQVPDMRSELLDLQQRLDAASNEASAARDELQAVQAQLERQRGEAAEAAQAARLELQQAQVQLEQQQQESKAAAEAAEAAKQQLRELAHARNAEADAARSDSTEQERQLQALRTEIAGLQEQAAAAAAAAAAAEEQHTRQAAALADAEGRLASLQQELEAAAQRQAALQQKIEEQAAQLGAAAEQQAVLEGQLAAACAERDSHARQLQRLQSDVSDAELLLASFLGGAGSSGGSLFATPSASPKRPAGAEAPASPADAREVAAAVQWLQQTAAAQQQQQDGGETGVPAGMAAGALAAAAGGAGGSRLVRRIQAVLLESQRLQQRQHQGEAAGIGSTSGGPSPADSQQGGPAASAAGEAAEAVAALLPDVPAPGSNKLPLLSPVHSEASGAGGIAAVHAGSSAALVDSTATSRRADTAAEEEGLGAGQKAQVLSTPSVQMMPGNVPIHSSPAKLASADLVTAPKQQQQGKARPSSANGHRERQQRGSKGGQNVLHAFVRNAGLAGVAGALVIQVLQHVHRR